MGSPITETDEQGYFDQETNLHYNWNRYYDPELGRYITSGPDGQFIFVADGVASLGLPLYDAYNTFTDDCLTPGEKAGRLAIDGAIGLTGLTLIKNGLRVVKALRGATKGTNPLKGTKYTDKVKQQMGGKDLDHNFPSLIDKQAGAGKVKNITGGDGVERTKVELPGSINGKDGDFSWIIEPNKTVNHRQF